MSTDRNKIVKSNTFLRILTSTHKLVKGISCSISTPSILIINILKYSTSIRKSIIICNSNSEKIYKYYDENGKIKFLSYENITNKQPKKSGQGKIQYFKELSDENIAFLNQILATTTTNETSNADIEICKSNYYYPEFIDHLLLNLNYKVVNKTDQHSDQIEGATNSNETEDDPDAPHIEGAPNSNETEDDPDAPQIEGAPNQIVYSKEPSITESKKQADSITTEKNKLEKLIDIINAIKDSKYKKYFNWAFQLISLVGIFAASYTTYVSALRVFTFTGYQGMYALIFTLVAASTAMDILVLAHSTIDSNIILSEKYKKSLKVIKILGMVTLCATLFPRSIVLRESMTNLVNKYVHNKLVTDVLVYIFIAINIVALVLGCANIFYPIRGTNSKAKSSNSNNSILKCFLYYFIASIFIAFNALGIFICEYQQLSILLRPQSTYTLIAIITLSAICGAGVISNWLQNLSWVNEVYADPNVLSKQLSFNTETNLRKSSFEPKEEDPSPTNEGQMPQQ